MKFGWLFVVAGVFACSEEPCTDAGTCDTGTPEVEATDRADTTLNMPTLVVQEAVGLFGAPCTNHLACARPADTCLRAEGAVVGYCSTTDCDRRPHVCPEGWYCTDLDLDEPGLTWACTSP